MEVGIIADIHSNLPALEAVLKDMGGVSSIYCAGDLVGYNPFPNEVIEIIRGKKVQCVLGNHDFAVLTGNTSFFNPRAAEAVEWTRKNISKGSLDFLRNLPYFNKNKFYLTHGSPESPLDEYVYPEFRNDVFERFFHVAGSDTIILGHTHKPYIKRLDGKLVFNPGAVGQPRDGDPRASYGILDTDKMEARIFRTEYDIQRVADKIDMVGLPQSLAKRLALGH